MSHTWNSAMKQNSQGRGIGVSDPHIPGTITDQTSEVVSAETLRTVNDDGR